MKEKLFHREPEWPGETSPVPLRAAPAARLRRQGIIYSTDVDELVSDFLQELESFSGELPFSQPLSTGNPAETVPASEPPQSRGGQALNSAISPEASPVKPETCSHDDIDAEIDRTLSELEARLLLKPADSSGLDSVPHESPVRDPIDPLVQAATPDPVGMDMSAHSEARSETLNSPGSLPPPESSMPLDPDPILFLRTSLSHSRKAGRRTAIAFAGVILTLAVIVALFYYFAVKSSHTSDSLEGNQETPSVLEIAVPGGSKPRASEEGYYLKESILPTGTTLCETALPAQEEVRVTVVEQGRVTNATAASGPFLLRAAAEDALHKWKFKPATLQVENKSRERLLYR